MKIPVTFSCHACDRSAIFRGTLNIGKLPKKSMVGDTAFIEEETGNLKQHEAAYGKSHRFFTAYFARSSYKQTGLSNSRIGIIELNLDERIKLSLEQGFLLIAAIEQVKEESLSELLASIRQGAELTRRNSRR